MPHESVTDQSAVPDVLTLIEKLSVSVVDIVGMLRQHREAINALRSDLNELAGRCGDLEAEIATIRKHVGLPYNVAEIGPT